MALPWPVPMDLEYRIWQVSYMTIPYRCQNIWSSTLCRTSYAEILLDMPSVAMHLLTHLCIIITVNLFAWSDSTKLLHWLMKVCCSCLFSVVLDCLRTVTSHNHPCYFAILYHGVSSLLWPPKAWPLYFTAVIYFFFCQHRWKTSHGISTQTWPVGRKWYRFTNAPKNFGDPPQIWGAKTFWPLILRLPHSTPHISGAKCRIDEQKC